MRAGDLSGGGTTTLTGSVFDPSGQVPLYNAVVYVPNGEVKPFTEGVTCDRCGSTTSGDPLVIALTDATGAYTLQNVPAGTSFPLAMQIGKWRRQVTIPAVPACTTTTLTDVNQQRLPRNKSEGDIPELGHRHRLGGPVRVPPPQGRGLDTQEFSRPDAGGRMPHVRDPAGESAAAPALRWRQPSAASLWSDPATLSRYDVISCPARAASSASPTPASRTW